MARKSTGPADLIPQNLKALRGALEHSVVLQAAKLQEVVDDLVARGTLTRAEADRLLGRLVASSKGYTAALLQVVDVVANEARRTVGAGVAAGVAPVMSTAGRVVETVKQAATGRTPKTAGPRPAGQAASSTAADAMPDIDSLTIAQARPRLAGLSTAQLREVRSKEASGKARKSLLAEIDRMLGE